jgi:hypothetical protein
MLYPVTCCLVLICCHYQHQLRRSGEVVIVLQVCVSKQGDSMQVHACSGELALSLLCGEHRSAVQHLRCKNKTSNEVMKQHSVKCRLHKSCQTAIPSPAPLQRKQRGFQPISRAQHTILPKYLHMQIAPCQAFSCLQKGHSSQL